MSRGEVVDFEVLRIQCELDRYQRTRSLPHIILDGVYSLDDIVTLYYSKLSPRHRRIADRLKQDYSIAVQNSVDTLKSALQKEYKYTMANLATEHDSFRFNIIQQKYRQGMNPVRALYYEYREVSRRYNPDNAVHIWLVGLLADADYRNILLDALLKDIQRLEQIIKRYYMPLSQHGQNIPLTLLHAKKTVSDFRHYYNAFEQFNPNAFDE
jgi:hypothetical protein